MALGGLIGRKPGMTRVYTPQGVRVPVTVPRAGPSPVAAPRRPAREGYAAAQVGFAPAKAQRLPKGLAGHFTKAGTGAFAVLREFRLADGELPAVGSEIKVGDVFKPGERVAVTGVSKGRGTAGVMKRHRFAGFPGSHGTHEYFRHGGSIGNRSFPGRVFKGKRMAGRLGNERVTVSNLRVVEGRANEDLLLLRGAVPGATGATV